MYVWPSYVLFSPIGPLFDPNFLSAWVFKFVEMSGVKCLLFRRVLAYFNGAGMEKKTHHAWCVFSKPCTKLTLHCNHRSGHLKTEHTESLFLLRRHLGNWPRGPALSMRSELLVAHEKLGQFPLLTVYVVPV